MAGAPLHPSASRSRRLWPRLIAALCISLLATAMLHGPPLRAEPAVSAPPGCEADPAWIMLDGERVVELRAAAAGRDPGSTAKEGSAKLSQLAKDLAFDPERLVAKEAPPYTFLGIRSRDGTGFQRLMAVDDTAGLCFSLSRQQLGARYLEQFRAAIRSYRSRHNLSSWLKGSSLALLMLLIYILWIRRQSQFRNKLEGMIRRREQQGLGTFTFAGNEFLDSTQVSRLLQALLRISHWSLFLLISYLLIPLLLSFFPPTMLIAAGLRGQILTVVSGLLQGIVAAIPNLLMVLVILGLTIGAIRFSNLCFHALGRGRLRFAWFYPEWALPTGRIASGLILLIGLVVAFPYVPGSDNRSFQGAGLFLGLLAAIGSSSIATNILSGLMLIYTRAFQEGDRVEINGILGIVEDRALLATRICTPRNEVVSIPNAAVINSSVVNFSLSSREVQRPVAIATTITIGYDVPWRHVHHLLLAAATSVTGISETEKPFVLQTSLNDFHISYELTVFVQNCNHDRQTLSSLLAAIQDQFAQADIEILSPAYHAVRRGERSTVPPAS